MIIIKITVSFTSNTIAIKSSNVKVSSGTFQWKVALGSTDQKQPTSAHLMSKRLYDQAHHQYIKGANKPWSEKT